jgi:hypothetical protein
MVLCRIAARTLKAEAFSAPRAGTGLYPHRSSGWFPANGGVNNELTSPFHYLMWGDRMTPPIPSYLPSGIPLIAL